MSTTQAAASSGKQKASVDDLVVELRQLNEKLARLDQYAAHLSTKDRDERRFQAVSRVVTAIVSSVVLAWALFSAEQQAVSGTLVELMAKNALATQLIPYYLVMILAAVGLWKAIRG